MASGSPSILHSINRLGYAEVGWDGLLGLTRLYGVLLLHLFYQYAQSLQIHNLISANLPKNSIYSTKSQLPKHCYYDVVATSPICFVETEEKCAKTF